MGIFEALYLVPKGIHLLCAVFFDFLEGGAFINAFSVFKNRNKHALCGYIGKLFFLPCAFGVENRKRLGSIGRWFVIKAYVIRHGLAAFVGIEAVEGLKARNGYFFCAFAYLDNRIKNAVSFYGCKLIYTAENRVALCGNQIFAHAEAVKLRALAQKLADKIFVKRV